MLALTFSPSVNAQSPGELKKEANRLFEDGEYVRAYPLYSQLVANFSQDAEYNYRLGVCMIYAEPDKKKCISYLKQASTNEKDAPKDVFFFLGQAYHINYLFDEALKNYNIFKSKAPVSLQKKLKVDKEIAACQNGKKLLSNLTDVVVQSKKELNEADYYRTYDLKGIGGKLLVKPDAFKTPADKKKKDNSIVFLPRNSNVVYFSSYGDNPENGKDIYSAYKLPNGEYSKPEKLNGINSPYDEDYPFLHPDGTTLYFASKGFNSMGGYDIFVSRYDETAGKWSTPENLEFPINSPDDDFLYVTDSLKQTAYFSTGRMSPPGKIDVLKVKTERKPIDVIAVSGSVMKETEGQSLASVISVKNLETNLPLGTYKADGEGKYEMELPNGSRLMFTVETPGLNKQTQELSLPLIKSSQTCHQIISYPQGKLHIENQLDPPDEETYKRYLKVIEQKAKLDVNEGVNQLQISGGEVVKNEKATVPDKPKEKVKPQVEVMDPAPAPKSNLQLAQMASDEANQQKQSAAQMMNDARDARETERIQREASEKDFKDAESLYEQAGNQTDPVENQKLTREADEVKHKAELEKGTADRIGSFAASLEADAAKKQQLSQLNESYAAELRKTADPKQRETAQQNIESLRKKIDEVEENGKSPDDVVTSLKDEIEAKEKTLATAQQNLEASKSEESEMTAGIAAKRDELAAAKKKSEKQRLEVEIEEETDKLNEAKKVTASREQEVARATSDLESLKSDLELTNKIKTEAIVPPVTPTPAAVAEERPFTAAQLKEKYTAINSSASNDPASLTSANTLLNEYNADIQKSISANKKSIAATKNVNTRTRLQNENKQLEAQLTKNRKAISANDAQLAALEKVQAEKQVASSDVYEPVVTNDPAKANEQLTSISGKLDDKEPPVFAYNNYENTEAQSLKQEADNRIREAMERQKKLKDEIKISQGEISAIRPVAVNAERSRNEADSLAELAGAKRKEANGKQGPEKDKLIREARQLEESSLDKQLLASDIAQIENKKAYDNNALNFSSLIAAGKAPDNDLLEARKLSEEAATAYKQAAGIRKEAESMGSRGAKVGILTNAEEKEAEALLKQQQAVTLLAKSNPEVELISTRPEPTADPASQEKQLSQSLDRVNTGLTEVATIRSDSYDKLYNANQKEISNITSKVQSGVNISPSDRTKLLAADKKLKEAEELKKQADGANGAAARLPLQTRALNSQNEALKLYAAVNTNIAQQPVASNTVVATPTETQASVTTTTEPVGSLPTPTVASENTNTVAASSETIATANTETPATAPTNTETVVESSGSVPPEIEQLGAGDTIPTAVVADANAGISKMTNASAGTQAREALDQINQLEREYLHPASELKSMTLEDIRKQNEVLLADAELLNDQANEKRKAASTAQEPEKEALLEEAKRLQLEAQDRTIEASTMIQEANNRQITANHKGIDELIAKVRKEFPDEAPDLNLELEGLKPVELQARQLREESEQLSNKAAKIGAASNAEERENELLRKQDEFIKKLKKHYPDFVIELPPPAEKENDPVAESERKIKIRKLQQEQLIRLTNAYTMEFETAKGNRTTGDAATRKRAENLNRESKRLLTKASEENDSNEKTRLLTLAAKAGNASLKELNKIMPTATGSDAALAEIGNRINGTPDRPARNTKSGKPIRVEGLEVITGNAYSDAKPIPMNAQIPDGLVFRVQIGAFKNTLPNDAFRGLSPVNGETTANGYFRYTAGNFNKFELANAVKNDLRSIGYNDAFVVVYFNGKRISIAEALEKLKTEGKTIDPNAAASAGITAENNIPAIAATPDNEEKVQVEKELDKTNGLLFTIQVGVYNKMVSKAKLLNLKPIFSEKIEGGFFRYTAGVYSNADRAVSDKDKVVTFGIRDAFVSAYLNGKKISLNEGKEKLASDSTIRLEQEKPVIFPAAAPVEAPANVNVPANAPESKPYTNNVSSYPAATAENGVKPDKAGIAFKIQVGAYSKEIPADVEAQYNAIKEWPVENIIVNNLYIYSVGNFVDVAHARAFRDQLVKSGMADCFITVYRDGRKLGGEEANTLLSR